MWTEGDAEWRPAHTIDGLFPTAGNVTLPNGRVRQFVAMAASHGISQGIAFPAAWRLAWKLGIDIPPPHFLRFSQLLLWSAFLTSIVIGILMAIRIGIMGWEYGFIIIGVLFGGLFGLCIAVYYFVTGRKLALPSWSDFGSNGSDEDSVLPSPFARCLKWAFSLDLNPPEANKWYKIIGGVGTAALVLGRIYMYYTRGTGNE